MELAILIVLGFIAVAAISIAGSTAAIRQAYDAWQSDSQPEESWETTYFLTEYQSIAASAAEGTRLAVAVADDVCVPLPVDRISRYAIVLQKRAD